MNILVHLNKSCSINSIWTSTICEHQEIKRTGRQCIHGSKQENVAKHDPNLVVTWSDPFHDKSLMQNQVAQENS